MLKELTAENTYCSPPPDPGWFAARWPSPVFYAGVVGIVLRAARLAKAGRYDAQAWIDSSLYCVRLLESVGGRLVIEHLDVPRRVAGACVFVGNHMSVLETFVLPCLIRPYRPVTFVIKDSLMTYPSFRHVMKTRQPIVVGRVDPRQDLKTVLEQGCERLGRGMSVVIFPQTTRSPDFDPRHFNSLGVKLARRAGVPVVPVALKTDAWGIGRRFKDFGPIRPQRTVHFCFGEPLAVSGSGKQEHQQVAEFIRTRLADWQRRAAQAGN